MRLTSKMTNDSTSPIKKTIEEKIEEIEKTKHIYKYIGKI